MFISSFIKLLVHTLRSKSTLCLFPESSRLFRHINTCTDISITISCYKRIIQTINKATTLRIFKLPQISYYPLRVRFWFRQKYFPTILC